MGGGGYIKLLPGKVDAKTFGGDTPYSIMFGPDLCGYDVSRIHLIFEHNGENLLKEDEIKLDYADKDEFTHLYTLVLEKDGSYEVFLDQDSKAQGLGRHDEDPGPRSSKTGRLRRHPRRDPGPGG